MSNEDFFIDGKRYLTTRAAVHAVGLTQNYVSKLCKNGFEGCRLVRGIWYVNEDALRDFLQKQEYRAASLA
jgi:hypothetical protein